jgi:hypothetical protein
MTKRRKLSKKHAEETPASKQVSVDDPPPLTLEVIEKKFHDRIEAGRLVFGDDYDGLIIPWQAEPKYTEDQIKAMNIDEVVHKLWEEYFVPGHDEFVRQHTRNPSAPPLLPALMRYLYQEQGKNDKRCFIGTAAHAREFLERPKWGDIFAFFCALRPGLIDFLNTYNEPPDFPCDEAAMARLRREDGGQTPAGAPTGLQDTILLDFDQTVLEEICESSTRVGIEYLVARLPGKGNARNPDHKTVRRAVDRLVAKGLVDDTGSRSGIACTLKGKAFVDGLAENP